MPNTEQSINETGGIPQITVSLEVAGMTQQPTDKTLTVADMPADAKATGEAIADLAVDLSGLIGTTFPVGSIYMTVNDSLPTDISAIGTWVEILLPLTWNDIRYGTRSYMEAENEDPTGPIHFWLRTE